MGTMNDKLLHEYDDCGRCGAPIVKRQFSEAGPIVTDMNDPRGIRYLGQTWRVTCENGHSIEQTLTEQM